MAKKIRYVDLSGVIIDDIRFPNEADFVWSFRGLLIRIDPYDGWKGHNDHESETALDDYGNWGLTAAPSYGCLRSMAEKIAALIQGGKV
jgi:hypothetical protein